MKYVTFVGVDNNTSLIFINHGMNSNNAALPEIQFLPFKLVPDPTLYIFGVVFFTVSRIKRWSVIFCEQRMKLNLLDIPEILRLDSPGTVRIVSRHISINFDKRTTRLWTLYYSTHLYLEIKQTNNVKTMGLDKKRKRKRTRDEFQWENVYNWIIVRC